ncbi:acyltransferase [Clostridium gasigenes]|uniref:acyltransferase n=1 Tax=Clostridium gasigenes TaxID=94869 RepID=UPI001C0DF3C0|nr:acyltransferase [Clostridium gasigenes]MBU3087631.1 acyltransferase [Clostridium gasigenes]
MILKKSLKFIDNYIYKFCRKYVDIMPERFIKIIAFYHPDPYLRKQYYEKLGVRMGENTLANLGLTVVRTGKNICLYIGDNVSIAPNVVFICKSEANNGKEINEIQYVKDILTKEGIIIVEDDVWIGANATIMPGITIGKCSIVGAGSVVTIDIEPYSVYAGVPARKIRDLKEN